MKWEEAYVVGKWFETLTSTSNQDAQTRGYFETYNFEVADWHTYHVAPENAGHLSLWVHNICENLLKIRNPDARAPLIKLVEMRRAAGRSNHGTSVGNVLRKHRPGNRQLEVAGGARWHVPPGQGYGSIPMHDPVGDQLQEAVIQASRKWKRSKLTDPEQEIIDSALAAGEFWKAHRWERQARGRWIESHVKAQFPQLKWSGVGVDAVDPRTGLAYDVMAGTRSNMDVHARRMHGIVYRMITH